MASFVMNKGRLGSLNNATPFSLGEGYAKRGCPDRMNAAELKAAQTDPDQFWAGVDEVKSAMIKTRDEGLTTRAKPTKSWF